MYARNAFKTAWFYLQFRGPFTKNTERIEKFRQTGNVDFI